MKIKKENGITLIALIVSIIVMLIISGISINFVLGDNGIISQAQDAKIMTDLSNYLFKLDTDIVSIKFDINKQKYTTYQLLKELENFNSNYGFLHEGGSSGLYRTSLTLKNATYIMLHI